MTKKNKALFVTCEGGEGAGKTTLLRKLDQALQKKGYTVLSSREPGGTELGDHIRQWLLHKHSPLSPEAELMLFLAARAQNLHEQIKPALQQGKIVLCDRFNDSTIAYQGFARGLGPEKVETLCKLLCDGLEPDITFFLDIDPKLGLARISKRNTLDRMENEALQFHEKVRFGLQQLAKKYPKRFCILDANQSEENVFQQALARLESAL